MNNSVNTSVRKNNTPHKPKWGSKTPKLFTVEIETQIIEFMKQMRLLELKRTHAQVKVRYGEQDMLRWLRRQNYNIWVLVNANGVRNPTLRTLAHLNTLKPGERFELTLFSEDPLNGLIQIERLGDDQYVIYNGRAKAWLADMLERGLFPNALANAVRGRFACKSTPNEVFDRAFIDLRNLARKHNAEVNTQYHEWVQTLGDCTIELLRDITKEYNEFKKPAA